MNKEIFFNILTRSSGRPIGFQKCYDSVRFQTYKNVKHIVTSDNDCDLEYLLGKDITLIKVKKTINPSFQNKLEGYRFAPYNLYCNDLLNSVDKGWIIFLDDDDNFIHNKVLEELVQKIISFDKDTLFIWQMRYPSGVILPRKNLFNNLITKNNIGSPCFMFHSKYKDIARWDSFKGSDFRFITKLKQSIPKHVFLNKVYVQINNFGDFGNKNDLSINNSKFLPFTYYKNLLWYLIPPYHFKIFNIHPFSKYTYISFLRRLKFKLKQVKKSLDSV